MNHKDSLKNLSNQMLKITWKWRRRIELQREKILKLTQRTDPSTQLKGDVARTGAPTGQHTWGGGPTSFFFKSMWDLPRCSEAPVKSCHVRAALLQLKSHTKDIFISTVTTIDLKLRSTVQTASTLPIPFTLYVLIRKQGLDHNLGSESWATLMMLSGNISLMV